MTHEQPIMSTKEAFEILQTAMHADASYAWAWHCNLAMAFYDAGGPHDIANKGAARFMHMAFGVDTTQSPEYQAILAKYAQQEPAP